MEPLLPAPIIAKIIGLLPLPSRAYCMTLSKSIYKYVRGKGLISKWWREQYKQIPSTQTICTICGILLPKSKHCVDKHMKKHEQRPDIHIYCRWECCQFCGIKYSYQLRKGRRERKHKKHVCVTEPKNSSAYRIAKGYQCMTFTFDGFG